MTLTRKRNNPRIEITNGSFGQKINDLIYWIYNCFKEDDNMKYKPSVHGLYTGGNSTKRRWTVPVYCGPPGTANLDQGIELSDGSRVTCSTGRRLRI